jgi:hypothetical protein
VKIIPLHTMKNKITTTEEHSPNVKEYLNFEQETDEI